ncbi:MAG: signal peptidase II [Thermoguttaceae bacterium]
MNRTRTSRFRLLLALFILSSCIGCDQATKRIATRTLHGSAPKSLLADTIRFDFALNPGGFLSLGCNLPDNIRIWVFVAFNSCLMLALFTFLCLKRRIQFLLFVSLVFILAGGIGNLIDRVWNHGLVTDFINVGIGPVRSGVFNVADMAVTFGAIAAVCLSFQRDACEQAGPAESPVRSE